MMILLVCGGRDYDDEYLLFATLNALEEPVALVHGAARGADCLAGKWARKNNVLEISVPAEWDIYGRSAGYIRNKKMVDDYCPDLILAFPGGKGTKMMMDIAMARGIPVRCVD